MRTLNALFTATLIAMLGSFSQGASAAGEAIKVTSIAETEVEVAGKDGKKSIKRVPVTKAVPGTEVIYTTVFENTIDKPAGNISINNPVPTHTEYKAGSAFGKDCEILFSFDGKTFGHAEELKITGPDGKQRTALPREYTHIRWNYKAELAPGKSAEVGFRAVIK